MVPFMCMNVCLLNTKNSDCKIWYFSLFCLTSIICIKIIIAYKYNDVIYTGWKFDWIFKLLRYELKIQFSLLVIFCQFICL